MLLEAYDGLLSRALSLNDLNRINIAFGNTMTPQETVDLREALQDPGYRLPELREGRKFSDAELLGAVHEWIDEMDAFLHLAGKPEAEPFLRRDLRKSVTLYTDGQPAAGKTLIVGMPGANDRLMVPMPAMLQCLPAERVDLVMVRDGTRSAYRQGLEGLADSLEAFADTLPIMLGFGAYRRVVGLGVSSGGLPIVLIALRLNLDAVLALGGNSPHDARWVRPGDLSPVVALKQAAERGYATRVTVACGAQHEVDCASAADTCALLGLEPLVVTADRDVKHNIVHPLLEEGRLPAFLAERLEF